MRAGELNKRITLQEKTVTRDAYGAEVESWADVATVWAAIEPLTGREFFAAQQVSADMTTRLRIRYRAGVTPTMRAVYGSRVFNLVSPPINPKEKHEELLLMVKEVV